MPHIPKGPVLQQVEEDNHWGTNKPRFTGRMAGKLEVSMRRRLRATSRPTGCRRWRSSTTTLSSAPRTRSTCSRVRRTARRRPTRNDSTCRRSACTTSASLSTSSDTVSAHLYRITCYHDMLVMVALCNRADHYIFAL